MDPKTYRKANDWKTLNVDLSRFTNPIKTASAGTSCAKVEPLRRISEPRPRYTETVRL